MFQFIFLFTIFLMASQGLAAHYDKRAVQQSLACLLAWSEKEMAVQQKPLVDLPEIRLSHEVSLGEFQDDVEPQWQLRPEVVSNVFVAHKNRIYLVSDKKDYQKNQRSIYDSLVHELIHYIQVKYQGRPIEDFGDMEEMTAIYAQNKFREEHPEALEDRYLCRP